MRGLLVPNWHLRGLRPRIWSWGGGAAMLVVGAGLVAGWSVDPLPPGLPGRAEQTEQEAWRAGAAELLPERYASFRHRLGDTRTKFLEERLRWGPWQDRERFEREFADLTEEGTALVQAVQASAVALRQDTEGLLHGQENRLARLRDAAMTLGMQMEHDSLASAGLALLEARTHFEGGHFERARPLIESAVGHLTRAEAQALAQMRRYADGPTVNRWGRWARETADWSRVRHAAAILVSKAERRLWLYQDGRVVKDYAVELGYNGLPDKLYEGDGATPEGRFRVTMMKGPGQTRFYKALLLDYPTPDHRRRLLTAKVQGRVPPQKTVGGLIEIHGRVRGEDDRTSGCVSIRNEQMDVLFEAVEPGTPVTIIGALTRDNQVAHQAELFQRAPESRI